MKKRSQVVLVKLYTTYSKIAFAHYSTNPTLIALLTPTLNILFFITKMIFKQQSLAFPTVHTAFNYPDCDNTSVESTIPTWSDPISSPVAPPVLVFTIALTKNSTNNNDASYHGSAPLTVPSSNHNLKHPPNGTGTQNNRLAETLGCCPPPTDIIFPHPNGLWNNQKNVINK